MNATYKIIEHPNHTIGEFASADMPEYYRETIAAMAVGERVESAALSDGEPMSDLRVTIIRTN